MQNELDNFDFVIAQSKGTCQGKCRWRCIAVDGDGIPCAGGGCGGCGGTWLWRQVSTNNPCAGSCVSGSCQCDDTPTNPCDAGVCSGSSNQIQLNCVCK